MRSAISRQIASRRGASGSFSGEAGPGPSYGDDDGKGGRVGFDNDFTRRNTTIMTWNLMHLAAMIRDAGGIPNRGNDRNAWKAGESFGFENPERRL